MDADIGFLKAKAEIMKYQIVYYKRLLFHYLGSRGPLSRRCKSLIMFLPPLTPKSG
jgi:hypothetical protein